MEDKEALYDEHIAPRMTEIIALCREHGIPFLASFKLNDGDRERDDQPLVCTTALGDIEGWDTEFDQAYNVLVEGWTARPTHCFAMAISRKRECD